MALQALFPTTANIVPYYRPIHAEKIVIIQKQNFARYKYKRYFLLHLNTTKFPMRLPLLPFLDERSCSGSRSSYASGEPTLENGEVMKSSSIIAKLHNILFKTKPQCNLASEAEDTYSNSKLNNPTYTVKSCIG